MIHDAWTLPVNDNVNPYAFSVELDGQWFLQKGKMIAYYGQVDFHAIGTAALDRLMAAQLPLPDARRRLGGRPGPRQDAARRPRPTTSTPTTSTTATSPSAPANLLAFQPGLALKQSIIPGFLTLIGTGKFVAASNGAVHFVEPPIRVDPQALVGWADCPSPCHHYDHAYLRGVLGGIRALTGLGGASGEEHQFEFVGAGQVLLQSTETVLAERATGAGPQPGT